MKKLLVILGFMLLGSGAYAQQRGGDPNATPETRAEMQTKRMTESLGLSDEQQKKVYTLQLARFQKMQELREAQNREGMQVVQEQYRTALAALLTPEQAKKNEELEAEMRANRGRRNN
ncbi:MAG: DUF4890 domain-containing protein [Bacteroidetes bacterium]|nr:DUF4890 domain-containing protein [Bacteroidota bacterium]